MQTGEQIRIIEEKVNALLANHPSHFLVEIRIKPTNNVKVFVDADEGVILSDLIEYNRKLYRQLEESSLFPDGDFSLEVSSPGLDQPLQLSRQYKKNVGRNLKLTLKTGEVLSGKLTETGDDSIKITLPEPKKKSKVPIDTASLEKNIEMSAISKAMIEISFK